MSRIENSMIYHGVVSNVTVFNSRASKNKCLSQTPHVRNLLWVSEHCQELKIPEALVWGGTLFF
jgi:hypothetical protein